MFFKIDLVVVLLFSFVIVFASAQDCKVGGKKCADHDQCCGGCCFDGECIDTYRSCYASLDVCDDHICLGEEECIVYIPPECPGCEPLPICRLPNV
uniref:SFRICE_013436 n=1 Tax=Spodoptera frugiperda TaxID=7108 RepID=A0A2H1VGJ7_SPOFR